MTINIDKVWLARMVDETDDFNYEIDRENLYYNSDATDRELDRILERDKDFCGLVWQYGGLYQTELDRNTMTFLEMTVS